ncbi:unnamed protein product, partial [marine sediment metagenome]
MTVSMEIDHKLAARIADSLQAMEAMTNIGK